MKITEEEIKSIAKLANLDLTKQEIEKYRKDMQDTMNFFEILKSEDGLRNRRGWRTR